VSQIELARIARLVEELHNKYSMADAAVRCKTIALELVDLFRSKAMYYRYPNYTG